MPYFEDVRASNIPQHERMPHEVYDDDASWESHDDAHLSVHSPTILCPVPASCDDSVDASEQCCAPLRAGGHPATVHCEDGNMLYTAEKTEDDIANHSYLWKTHENIANDSYLSHERMSYVEQSSWASHDDDCLVPSPTVFCPVQADSTISYTEDAS